MSVELAKKFVDKIFEVNKKSSKSSKIGALEIFRCVSNNL